MTSVNEGKKTVKCPARREDSIMNDKLSELRCPFTWGMQNVIERHNKLLDANKNRFEMIIDIQDQFPEFVLIYHLLLAYENVMSDDLPSATQSVSEAEKSLADIKKKKTLEDVENVLEHIFVATKCHVLQKQKQMKEVGELLDEICDIDDMDKTESAMLSGCQCLAWSVYYATDNMKAIECAEKAIEYEPDNGKWHFLLGKNHRRLRRRHNSIGVRPNVKEIAAFSEAFRLSPNVLFGVSLAQMYRESLNYAMANKTYENVYYLEPTCCKVRLQLALGFIRAKNYDLAKDCLDYVAAKMPDSNIYTHYMAIYIEKRYCDYEAALPYYKTTTENSNHAAEWQYVECRRRVERHWDPLPYMLSLIEKYDKDTDHVCQGINIQIGWHYLFELHNVLSACPYLAQAIKIAPDAKLLKEHRLFFPNFGQVNIYHALREELELASKGRATLYDDEKRVILKETLELCLENCKTWLPPSSSYRVGIGSQLSRHSGNHGRGFSSRGRASPRGFPGYHPQQSSDDAQRPRGLFSGLHRERIDTSKRSDKQGSGGTQSKPNLSNISKNEKDRGFTARGRGRDFRPTASSNPREKSDNNEEAAASCSLVKAVKKLNI